MADNVAKFNEGLAMMKAKDWDGLKACYAADCVSESTRSSGEVVKMEGADAIIAALQGMWEKFPNATWEVSNLVADGADSISYESTADMGDGNVRKSKGKATFNADGKIVSTVSTPA